MKNPIAKLRTMNAPKHAATSQWRRALRDIFMRYNVEVERGHNGAAELTEASRCDPPLWIRSNDRLGVAWLICLCPDLCCDVLWKTPRPVAFATFHGTLNPSFRRRKTVTTKAMRVPIVTAMHTQPVRTFSNSLVDRFVHGQRLTLEARRGRRTSPLGRQVMSHSSAPC